MGRSECGYSTTSRTGSSGIKRALRPLCGKISGSFIEGRFSRIDHAKEKGWSRWVARVIEPGVMEVGDWIRIQNV